MAIVEMPDGSRKRFPGVTKNGRRYYARIRVGRRVQYLGNGRGFDTPEEAHAAYEAHRLKMKPAYVKPKRRSDGRTSAAQKMSAYLEARTQGLPDRELSDTYPLGDKFDLMLPDGAWMHYLGFEVVPMVPVRDAKGQPDGDKVWRHAVPVLLWARDCRKCHGEKAVPFKTLPGTFPDSIPATCIECTRQESAVELLDVVDEGADLV